MKLSRRGFLGLCAGGAIAASALSLRSSRNVIDDLEATHTIVRVPSLPREFASYRIALLSDLHLGIFVPNELLESALRIANSYQPNLTILGGDYIGIPDSFPGVLFSDSRNQTFRGLKYRELVPAIFETLSKILSKAVSPDGTVAVLGNHDNWHNPEICCKILKESPIQFLINQTLTIKRGSAQLKVLGVDDLWTGVPRVPKEFITVEPNQTRLLVSHNPDFLVETLDHYGSVFDLGVAGHTHGGQIKIAPLGAIGGYNIRHSAFGEGLVPYKGSQLYTTRGIGVVDLPYRISCRPEVSILELQPT